MMRCLSGKLSWWGGGGRPEWVFVLVGSCPVGESSWWGVVLVGTCPGGGLSRVESCSGGAWPSGELY